MSNIYVQECIIKEIVVEPLLASNFEEAVKHALLHAIDNDVNVTVMRQGRAFRIVPREIVRGIFGQHVTEGSD